MTTSKRPTLTLLWGLAVAVMLVGCQEKPPNRWEKAEKESEKSPEAVSDEAVAGGEFNRFFPQVKSPWDIVYKQEKSGFSQASLKQDGREVAILSVSDTKNNPEAKEKFQGSGESIGGSPAVMIGEQGTAVLVNDRFQVQVRSMDPSFGPDERKEWLAKFDLDSIGRIH